MQMSINGLELDSDNKSSIDFKNPSRSLQETLELESSSSLERLEELIMITTLLKEKLKEEKKLREKKSQLISKLRELESIK